MAQKWRIGLTILLVVLACIAFWDTFRLWTMSDADKKALDDKTPGAVQQLQADAIRLGLDLQGGIHVVLRVKLEELEPEARVDAVDRAIQVVRNRVDGLGVAEPVIQQQGDDRIIVDLPGYTDAARAEELIGQTAELQFKLLESIDNANLVLKRIDSVVAAYEKSKTGVTSTTPTSTPTTTPATTATATDTTKKPVDMLAELMGDSAKKDTAGQFDFDEPGAEEVLEDPVTSRMELALFNSQTNTSWPSYTVSRKDRAMIERWLALPQVQAVIPPDVELAWSTRSTIRDAREIWELYVLKRKVQFAGRYLEGISMGREPTGGFTVDFTLSGEGAARFAQLTGANINKPLAIVLDNEIESAPMINSKIRNRGQITMGSSASFEDARNLEIVLKAGALPAPVEIIAKNVVGATLGSDSVSKGFYASMIGLALVLAYIAFYYRISGVIADIGLLFNLFFLLAAMAALSATLTMPGIAGIILTIGMSVDSNILIFERIREELRAGKTVRAAIDAGYDRAWQAILDSHVTTLITAAALYLFGSGTIKGFAVSLFLGVFISLFTAYVITKLIFDLRKQYQTISI